MMISRTQAPSFLKNLCNVCEPILLLMLEAGRTRANQYDETVVHGRYYTRKRLMTDSAARLECSVCQGEMLSKDGQAFCPVCLMKQGMHASSMGGFAAMRDWKPPAVEELVNRFPSLEIESLIGQGGMG